MVVHRLHNGTVFIEYISKALLNNYYIEHFLGINIHVCVTIVHEQINKRIIGYEMRVIKKKKTWLQDRVYTNNDVTASVPL